MNEIKTTFKRLALYHLLLAASIIPCANLIPDSFPTRNLSSIYLIFLAVCLILYYSYRVSRQGRLSVMMKLLSFMALFLIVLRGVKYSVFAGVDVLARHIWYMYYIPMLLMPLFFFYLSLLVSPKGKLKISGKWYLTATVTLVLIVLVMTNDLHQLVFIFKPGFADWDSSYSYGLLFYITAAWQFALYLTAVIILVVKCRIGVSKKNAWLTLIPFLLGIAESALLMTDKMPRINGTHIIELPETLILMAAGILECCIQLGLIPTNKGYAKLFHTFPICAQITDHSGKPVYVSGSAVPLTEAQFNAPDGARTGEHTVLHRMALPGGFGFWQDDMTELDRLNEELEDAKEQLSQEAELIRLQNELAEKQTKIEQRTALYDTIAKRTQRQSAAISRLAETARLSSDTTVREKCCRQIAVFGTFIKRYANLMLLSDKSETIESGELGLSVSEVLRCLNFSGIPGELVNTADNEAPAEAALAVFEVFGLLLEANISDLRGVFVNIACKDTVVFKLTLENTEALLPGDAAQKLSGAGIRTETMHEDGVTYISFIFPERRNAA